MYRFTLLVGIFFLAFMPAANATVGHCAAQGYVNLSYSNDDWIEGSIGQDYVGLAYYRSFIYGDINGQQVSLNVNRNGTITGNIGRAWIQWHTDFQGHIFGFQPCILVVSNRP